jgi:hypothetical protein
LAGFVQNIAKAYNSPEYQTAADEFRIPFWDWAAIPQRFPDVMTWPSVNINTPTGPQNVTNPLYRYTFLNHPEPAAWFPPDEESYLGSQPWTLRNPDSNNNSIESAINDQFAEEGQFLSDQVVSQKFFVVASLTRVVVDFRQNERFQFHVYNWQWRELV